MRRINVKHNRINTFVNLVRLLKKLYLKYGYGHDTIGIYGKYCIPTNYNQ